MSQKSEPQLDASQMYRISMVGTSGAGKTCWLACLYNLFQNPRQGFTLLAENDQAMDLEDLWEELEDLNAGDEFSIPGTASERDFCFKLCFGGRPIAQLNWADYRGGLLDVRSSDGDSGESVKELIEQVRGSQSLVLIVDSLQLMLDDQRKAQRQTKMKRLLRFLQEFISTTEIDPDLCIHILLTKSEVFLGDLQGVQRLQARCEEMMQGVISLCQESSVKCRVIPVSVIGQGHRIGEGAPVLSGSVKPINADKPMLGIIRSLLNQRRRKLNTQLSTNQATLNEYQQATREAKIESQKARDREGLFDNIISSFQGRESGRSQRVRLEEAIGKLGSSTDHVLSTIGILQQQLEKMECALSRLEGEFK